MDQTKLRHVGFLTGLCAGVSVLIGLTIQILLRLVLANMEGVQFGSIDVLAMLRGIFTMAIMGGILGLVIGIFTKPDQKASAKADGSKSDVDESARETLAKLGIPADKADSSK